MKVNVTELRNLLEMAVYAFILLFFGIMVGWVFAHAPLLPDTIPNSYVSIMIVLALIFDWFFILGLALAELLWAVVFKIFPSKKKRTSETLTATP